MADETITLSVEGMSCEHCRCRVERALAETPGVAGAEVDLESATATVTTGDGAPSADDLIAAVEAVGYRASVAE